MSNFADGNRQGYANPLSRPFAAQGGAWRARWISPFEGDRTLQLKLDFGTPDQVDMDPIAAGAQDGKTYRYFKVNIGDGVSTTNTVTSNGQTATRTIDVSSLDVTKRWTIKIEYPTTGNDMNTGEQDRNEVQIELDDVAGLYAAGTALEFDSTASPAGTLAIYSAGAKVASGGTVDLGSFPVAGVSEAFDVNVRAEGQGIVEVTATGRTGDVLTFEDPAPNGKAYPTAMGYFLQGTLDTSGAAGSYSGTITLTTAAGVYTVNINYTLV